jgi:putative hydrolase of the HAD superfamily
VSNPHLLHGIRAVVFDAVGTLVHPEPSAAQAYALVGKRYGSRLAAGEIVDRFRTAFQREEAWDRDHGWQTNEVREVRRWQTIVANVLDDVTDSAACFRDLFAHFARPDAWRCGTDVEAVLAHLERDGQILALASNYDRRLYPVQAGMPELRPIQQILISSEIGWRKPAREFFLAVCQRLRLPPEQVLHVGDDPVNDVAGAQAVGLRAVRYDPRDKAVNGAPTRIQRLGELLA